MTLWDRICIHACYHDWNPITLILKDEWAAEVVALYGPTYPGWRELI